MFTFTRCGRHIQDTYTHAYILGTLVSPVSGFFASIILVQASKEKFDRSSVGLNINFIAIA